MLAAILHGFDKIENGAIKAACDFRHALGMQLGVAFYIESILQSTVRLEGKS